MKLRIEVQVEHPDGRRWSIEYDKKPGNYQRVILLAFIVRLGIWSPG